ncbi:MAG: hypothetical protein L7F78_24485, partial [Syntrophales bacterium LBB04]|nr:hypothetical protein [Syntrophales bacterium LBB04]
MIKQWFEIDLGPALQIADIEPELQVFRNCDYGVIGLQPAVAVKRRTAFRNRSFKELFHLVHIDLSFILFSQSQQIIASQLLSPIIFGSGNCSGLIAWGEYTKDGSTIAARNWDLSTKALEPFQKFFTVAVFNPVGSGQGVADINYAGQITWQSAMNQSGIFYDLQNGMMSDPYSAKNRLNSNSALMTMMLDSTSLEQVDAFFNSTRAEGGLIINVADAKQGYCYEWGTFDFRRRVDDPKGLMADSNDYVDPSWPVTRDLPGGQPSAFTKERRANLLALGGKYKGKIDAGKMMDIFDTRIPDGGPTFPVGLDIKTYYTIIAVPKELKLWLQADGLQKWTEID